MAETAEAVAIAETEPEPPAEDVVVVEDVAAEEPVAVSPKFALVRVEPDGSAVIAGSASPASEVQIFANGDLLGSETTEAGGDFVYVTGEPLPSGGVELRLLDVASGEFATTSIVVIVQDDRTSEPLVVASEPGEASEILQGIEAAPTPVQEPQAEVSAEADAEPVIEVAEDAAAVEVEVAVADEEPVQEVLEVAHAEEPANDEPVVEPVIEPVASDPVSDVVEETVIEDAEETITQEEPAAKEAPAPELVIVPPTIDAVEIDGDRNFFAGGGTDSLAVRLYVENRPVGTAQVEDGRWLIEAINVLTAATQRIRVDMLNADGSVAGRAEVNFVIDLPEQEPAEQPEPPVVVADAPEAEPVEEAEPVAEPVVKEPVVEEPVAEDVAEAPVPTIVGTADGDRTTSGQVIIRRGDNLWTIARRVYGEGLRYTQIYEANANTIRNPDLIYPGQVFDLPGTDMVLGEEP